VQTRNDRPTRLLLRDMVFETLRVKDERLNALAVEVCGRCGADVDRRIVLEACDRKNGRAHRLHALRAVQRVGSVTDPISLYDLDIVAHVGPNAEIRTAVSYLIVTLLGAGRETPRVASVEGRGQGHVRGSRTSTRPVRRFIAATVQNP
jgi:hypothetical protein